MGVVPDLAAEVLSPENIPTEMERKMNDYLASGTKVVGIIGPVTRTAELHQMDDASTIVKSLLSRGSALTAISILPGLSVPVATVLR